MEKLLFSILFMALLGILIHTSSSAQRVGEQAEMDRLERQAENLAAQNDPEGAALAIGKAAMMADLLIQKAQKPDAKIVFQAASSQYRGQELGLRALALFEQTGGNPPAPPGICHYLFQGHQKLHASKNLLHSLPSSSSRETKGRQKNLGQKNMEWRNLLKDLQGEFECQAPHPEN